jgi:signal transduction histidine kinase
MDQLILDLLTYSRLTSIDVDFRTLALDDVVEKVLRELAADLEASSAIVSVDRPLPSVRANLTLLGQVLANLISNAVKFVAPGETPKVRISSITTQDSQGQAVVRLFVDDAGIGVPAEQQDRIFKTFERLHGIEVYPGTGIGLAIVRKAMQRLDGAVGVEPGPSGGSRFWVELPAAGES